MSRTLSKQISISVVSAAAAVMLNASGSAVAAPAMASNTAAKDKAPAPNKSQVTLPANPLKDVSSQLSDPAQKIAPYSLLVIRASNKEIQAAQLDGWLAQARKNGEPADYLCLATSRLLAFNRDFDGSLRMAQKANIMHPGDAIFLCGLGRAYATLDRQSEAERCYRQALNSKTLSAFSAEMLANCFLEFDDFEDAYDAGMKGLKLKGASNSLRYRTADVAKNLGHFKDAEVLVKEAFKYGATIELWNIYSEIERGLKNWKEVIVACDNVLAYKQPPGRKKMIEAQNHKAEAYQQLGDYKSAVREWTIALKRLPFNQNYLRNRALCYSKLGDKASEAKDLAAMKNFDQSLKDN